MKYDHVVKRNGKYYAANEEVPDNITIQDKNISSNQTVELPFSDTDIELETNAVKRGRPKKNLV